MKNTLTKFLADESGATAVEYALVVGLVATALAGLGTNFSTALSGLWSKMNTAITNVDFKNATATSTTTK